MKFRKKLPLQFVHLILVSVVAVRSTIIIVEDAKGNRVMQTRHGSQHGKLHKSRNLSKIDKKKFQNGTMLV